MLYRGDIVGGTVLASTRYSEIFLISLAVACLHFSCADLYFQASTLGTIDPSTTTAITNTFLLLEK